MKNYETSFNTFTSHTDKNEDKIADKVAEVTSLLPVSCENLLEASLSSIRNQPDGDSHSSPKPCPTECDNSKEDATPSRELPSVDYRCTPPSTAPLPMKFHLSYKKLATTSIRSDSDLINCDVSDPCRLNRFNIEESGTNLTDKSDVFSDNGEKIEPPDICSNDECPQKHGKTLHPNEKETFLSRESVENDIAISTSDYSSASRITLYLSSHGSDPSICKLCLLNTQSVHTMGKNVLSPISDKSQEATNEPPITVLQKNVKNNSIQPTLQQKKSNLRLEINSFKNMKPRLGKLINSLLSLQLANKKDFSV